MIKKLGLQLYSVRDHMQTPQDVKATFQILKKIGYDEVQTAGCYGLPYEEFYTYAHEAGIEIIGTHDDFDMMKHDIDRSIENHKLLKTTNMGIGGFPARSEEETVGFIALANQIARRIAQEGMKFTYHNHSQEFIRFASGKTSMEYLMEGLDAENTSFVLDTYWVQHAGGDPVEWIQKLAGRIDIFHLKDMGARREADGRVVPYITEVGNGHLNFGRIIEAALAAGVKHFCVEQDTWECDSLLAVEKSSQYLHKHFM